jgi:3-phenylpropionate/cinnamic acid dioxygenase small subunit
MTRAEAEDFLYREARLLDERRFEDWLALFDDEAHYWLPRHEHDDPRRDAALAYDDRRTLGDRVERLRSPAAHAQAPPSRTRHLVTNVEVEDAPDTGVRLRSNFAVYELRTGGERTFAGHAEHYLRRTEDGWRIHLKKVVLVNADQPLYNLTFLL